MQSTLVNPVFILLASLAVAAADLPKKAPISRYNGLWTNSPFTSKPPPVGPGEVANPLDDYALIGVSPIGGSGHRVTLINKKKPEERITVDSDKPVKDGFKVLEVIRKAGDPLGTTVRMNSGSMTGTVAFDTKLLTLVSAPKAAPPQPGQPPQAGQPVLPPPGTPPAQPGQPGQPLRQPRPRVVPPPTPQSGAQVLPNQPAPQINQNQRPTRRGN
ncbi:hypothetical protein HQ447_02090 [bacterium]|nr:hypothetical protein [bacterium]